MQFTNVMDEANERHDIVGHSMIRPGCVVEMSHCHVLGVCLCQLQVRVWQQRERRGGRGNVCMRVMRVCLSVIELTFSSLNFLNSYSANGMLDENVTRNLFSTVRESCNFSGQ